MPIYSFPVIGNPSTASTRSVMYALAAVLMSLLSGFGVVYLLGLIGVDSGKLFWLPVLFMAPAVVFAMFAVVRAESNREAHFRDMSMLVSDAIVLNSGIELSERDIRRMVDGDEITDAEAGVMRIEIQSNGRNRAMVLVRDAPSHVETNVKEYDLLSEYEDDLSNDKPADPAPSAKEEKHNGSSVYVSDDTTEIPVKPEKTPLTPMPPKLTPSKSLLS